MLIRPRDVVKPPTTSEAPTGLRRPRARTAVGVGHWWLLIGAGLAVILAGLLLVVFTFSGHSPDGPRPSPVSPEPAATRPTTPPTAAPSRDDKPSAPLDLPPRPAPKGKPLRRRRCPAARGCLQSEEAEGLLT